MNKPIVGITMGDPAGSGPEITIKALADPEQYSYCRPIVVGDVKVMEQFGPVLADTCMVVAPIEGTFQRTGTNSAKAGNYLPTLCSQKAMVRDVSALLEVVM